MRLVLKYSLLVGLALLGALIAWLVYRNPEPEPVVIIPREEKTVRILEGWTNKDIAEYLEESGLWPAEEFLSAVGTHQAGFTPDAKPDLTVWRGKYEWLPEDIDSLEGYLFPDTYRIYASSTPDELISRMLDNFDLKLNPEMVAEIERQKKSLTEIISLASIIEKEAPISNIEEGDRDAKLVSGVFWNRLEIGQALQSDATLSYLFSDNKPQHSGAELEVDSPYNSYKYAGLPPGPIGNPGLIAIRAAIYPAETNYYYFLTPPDSREVIYARTYAEHLQNKYKYLK